MHVLKNGIFFLLILLLFLTLWSMRRASLLLNFPFLLILIVPLWIYFRIQQNNQRKAVLLSKEFPINLFFVYMLTVIYVTLEPFHFTPPSLNDGKMNLIPYVQILYQYKYKPPFFWMLYTLGNILLFIPFGLLLPFLYKKRFRAFVILGLAILCSLSIETIQFFFTVDRAADIDDFILNIFGAMVGYFLFLFMGLFARRLLHKC